jgi:hypothetical protein
MDDEKMSDFLLAGGTNLALRIGHRTSIDLDLFSYQRFAAVPLAEYLIEKFNLKTTDVRPENTVQGYIEGVKMDIIAHIYPLVEKPFVEDGVRLYSLSDIAAMKLGAISNNGTRLKDFVDIAYLSTKMSFSQMLYAFAIKYKNASTLIAIRGLSYFNDIKFNTVIELTKSRKFDWNKIRRRILQMIKYENKVFDTEPI